MRKPVSSSASFTCGAKLALVLHLRQGVCPKSLGNQLFQQKDGSFEAKRPAQAHALLQTPGMTLDASFGCSVNHST